MDPADGDLAILKPPRQKEGKLAAPGLQFVPFIYFFRVQGPKFNVKYLPRCPSKL